MFGVAIWGVSGRVVPRNYVKIFVSLLSLDIKKVVVLALAAKKTDVCLGPFVGFGGFGPPKLCENNYVLKISTDTQKN